MLMLSFGTIAEEGIDEMVLALRNLDKSVANNQLAQAENQLQALQQRIPGDTRLEQAQREISAAYLRQGEGALKAGNLQGAAQSLTKAQRIQPIASAQATALAEAIQQTQQKQDAQALAVTQAAEAKAKAAAAEKAEQLRKQKLAAEQKATAERKAAEAAALAATPKEPVARLINLQAPSTVIGMPMLDSKDNAGLRELLDQVAEDVVAFRCKVSINVRQNKDYLWVTALLSARVKKLDPGFSLQLEQNLNPANAPQLVLTPQP
ncbi:MAG TPA: hypothetical protein VN303_06380 [Pseudomonas sp.]|nr:hypothetical protein [Pseudomonas sp.]